MTENDLRDAYNRGLERAALLLDKWADDAQQEGEVHEVDTLRHYASVIRLLKDETL